MGIKKQAHRQTGGIGMARRAGIVLASLALAALLAAVVSNAASKKTTGLPATVQIGVLDEMSGSAAFCGVQEIKGMALALKEAKRQKFLGKTQVSMKIYDDGGKNDNAVIGVKSLMDGGASIIVGPCVGGTANVTIPLTEQANMPQIITTASAANVTPLNAFRAGIQQPRYASQVITLLHNRGVKRVSVFFDSGQVSIVGPVWGQTQKQALKSYKMEIAEELSAPVSASGLSDFSSQVAKLVQSKPDAIGVLLQGAPNLTVVNQLRQAGYTGPIWGQQGMLAPFFLGGGPNVNGTLVSVAFAAGLGPDSAKNFTKRYEQRYPGETPTELGAHGYDAMWMALRGLKAANSTDKQKIIDALTKIKAMPAAQGNPLLKFNGIGDAVGKGSVVQVKDGILVGVAK
jgi:branched-chain amino acid transport system substrate-binding protein